MTWAFCSYLANIATVFSSASKIDSWPSLDSGRANKALCPNSLKQAEGSRKQKGINKIDCHTWYILNTPPHLSIPVHHILNTPLRLAIPVHHTPPHVTIPVPSFGDPGLSCILSTAPHLAIPVHQMSYILDTPPHLAIPVHHMSDILDMPPHFSVPVHHIS